MRQYTDHRLLNESLASILIYHLCNIVIFSVKEISLFSGGSLLKIKFTLFLHTCINYRKFSLSSANIILY